MIIFMKENGEMNNLFDQFKVMKSNKHYRLGDLILCRGNRWIYDSKIILSDNQFNGSFLKDYLQSRKVDEGVDNHSLITNLKKHSQKTIFDDNTLYVNIRLGDSVINSIGEVNAQDAYGRDRKLFIFYPAKLMFRISDTLRKFPKIDKIQFVSSLHFGDNEIKNIWRFSQEAINENRRKMEIYFDFIKKKFNCDLSVITMLENDIQDIDNHFLTLCIAKHVILDGSHFGELILKARNLIFKNDQSQT